LDEEMRSSSCPLCGGRLLRDGEPGEAARTCIECGWTDADPDAAEAEEPSHGRIVDLQTWRRRRARRPHRPDDATGSDSPRG
jgi:hypothetical protein